MFGTIKIVCFGNNWTKNDPDSSQDVANVSEGANIPLPAIHLSALSTPILTTHSFVNEEDEG